MESIGKKIEIIANIAIIAIAILIGIVAYQKYFKKTDPSPQTQQQAQQPIIPVGAKLSLGNIDWTKSKKNIVLALQDTCKYCSESAPFYQRLIPKAEKNSIPIIAVFPDSGTIDQNKKYLDGLKVPLREIRLSKLDAVKVQGTPTLYIVNEKGEITKGWIGKLNSSGEEEVLNYLKQ